jgi:hypothetical protein
MQRLFPLEGKYYMGLLISAVMAVTGLAALAVWGERECNWDIAQASLLAILLLLAVIFWGWWRANRRPHQVPIEAAAYNRGIRKLLLCVAIGFTGLLINATRKDHWQYATVAKAIGFGTLVAGAAFMSGVLLGFLFGFRPTSVSQSFGDQSSNVRPHPYTNLEEIADWLTKIILGAGLVELTSMRVPIGQLARFIARGVDPPPPQAKLDPGSPSVALAIMTFFFTSGILYGYLWTRYELSLAADTSGDDTSALTLVDRWLNHPTLLNDQARMDMMNAVKGASLATKLRIFLQAEQYRKPSTEDINTRSLPVFQALVEADLQEVFHRNRSQYALALMGKKKDPNNPDDDWNRALDLLNKAIWIRDQYGEKGWQDYELARAACQVHLDANFKKGQPSNTVERQSILADLNKAKDVPVAVLDVIDKAHVIAAWKGQNSVT